MSSGFLTFWKSFWWNFREERDEKRGFEVGRGERKNQTRQGRNLVFNIRSTRRCAT